MDLFCEHCGLTNELRVERNQNLKLKRQLEDKEELILLQAKKIQELEELPRTIRNTEPLLGNLPLGLPQATSAVEELFKRTDLDDDNFVSEVSALEEGMLRTSPTDSHKRIHGDERTECYEDHCECGYGTTEDEDDIHE